MVRHLHAACLKRLAFTKVRAASGLWRYGATFTLCGARLDIGDTVRFVGLKTERGRPLALPDLQITGDEYNNADDLAARSYRAASGG